MPIKKGKGGYTVKYPGSPAVKVKSMVKAKRVQKKQKKG